MAASFYIECRCSLLSVRPHQVTSAADWNRHLAAQEQDRLAELFDTSESEGEPVYTGDQDPQTSDEDPPSPVAPPAAEDPPSPIVSEPSIRELSDQFRESLDPPSPWPVSNSPGEYDSPNGDFRLGSDPEPETDPPSPIEQDDNQDPTSHGMSGEDITEGNPGLDGSYRMDLDDIALERHENSSTLPALAEEWSYDEEIFDDKEVNQLLNDSDNVELENGSASDRVGQMRRGFVDLVEKNLGASSDYSTSDHESGSAKTRMTTSEEDPDDKESFPYGEKKSEMTGEEILAVSMHHLKLTHNLTRAACADFTDLLTGFTNNKACWDYRTTRKWIEKQTGVKAISYDCCLKSCMSFAMYPDKDSCDYCHLSRWREGTKKVPNATHEYIPITHRLKLWYADSRRAATMVLYRRQAESQDACTDYWTSSLFRELKGKQLFAENTDLGFLLTTDGVQVFKAKTSFSVWPIALQCLNLPPTIRSKRQNMLCVGFIPGPKGPKNLDSFLYPLVAEFRQLQIGVSSALNSSIPSSLPNYEREFTLKAHICLVGADMVAREKVMKVTGNRSYSYCEYCLIQGVWNRGLYCPCTPPSDTPPHEQSRKSSRYPWNHWNRRDLPMRNNEEFRRTAAQVARKGATDKQCSKYGVKGLSILSQLSSIDFPRSFPPDSMHLWFENVVPDLVKHWRGKYRVETPEIEDGTAVGGSEADDESSGTESSEEGSGRDEHRTKKRKAKGKNGPRGRRRGKKSKVEKIIAAKAKGPKAKEPKAVATDDPYNIPLQLWESLSRDIVESAVTIPALFGPVLRNFLEHINQMTAAEWQQFTFLLAPVYLKDILPDEDYDEFISLVEGIQLSCDYILTKQDLTEMEERMLRFSIYYEKRYYRLEWERLKACLPVFHQILHVPQAMRWAGPMYVYSQWAMERFCGTLAGMAKSRVATNRNLSIGLTLLEQKSTLVYVIDHGVPESEDEDEDGNIRLAKFLTKKLENSRPSDGGELKGIDYLLFCGPSTLHTLTTHERICLKAFYLNEQAQNPNNNKADLETKVDTYDSYFSAGVCCRVFRAASYDTCIRGDPYAFKSTSSTCRRSNQSRSTAHVRYETFDRVYGRESRFGEVIFFFSILLEGELPVTCPPDLMGQQAVEERVREQERGLIRRKEENELLLAYIRDFPVQRDGRLLYRESKGVKRVILATNIHELIGLLRKGGREYIVRKNSALF